MAKRENYGKWSEQDMEMALRAYTSMEKGLSQCSWDYNISKSTLLQDIRYVNNRAKEKNDHLGGLLHLTLK